MEKAPLACRDDDCTPHLSPCVRSLACWWREVMEQERRLGYSRSSRAGKAAWEMLMNHEAAAPNVGLYVELRDCARLWQRISEGRAMVWPSLLDRMVWVAAEERLELPRYGVLAAFRLRQRLMGMSCQPGAASSLSMEPGQKTGS